jgi:ribosomal protein S18 acetylase RimI-like enzyme
MLTREWSDWNNRWHLWLQSVYVLPSFRRRGVFSALLEHVIALAGDAELGETGQAPNGQELRLYVHTHNRPAIDTYLRSGFNTSEYEILTLSAAATRSQRA